jgi:hypothetical protein
VRYTIGELINFVTPQAEMLFKFNGFAKAQFNFPETVKAILFMKSKQVPASEPGEQDYFQIEGRLYASANPRETGENHIGKLYVNVHNHPDNTEFRTATVKLVWHSDGSIEFITEDGKRVHREEQS